MPVNAPVRSSGRYRAGQAAKRRASSIWVRTRWWELGEAGDALEQFALPPCLEECRRFDRAKARSSVDPHADRVLSVWLLVDPTLDAHASAATAARHAGSSVPELGWGE